MKLRIFLDNDDYSKNYNLVIIPDIFSEKEEDLSFYGRMLCVAARDLINDKARYDDKMDRA